MPNERMVRSSGVPVSSTAIASEHTQLTAMWAAPVTYERSTTSSNGRPHATRTPTRAGRPEGSRSTSARALAPPGELISTGA